MSCDGAGVLYLELEALQGARSLNGIRLRLAPRSGGHSAGLCSPPSITLQLKTQPREAVLFTDFLEDFSYFYLSH